MKYKSAKKPDKCPQCGSDKIAKILYGFPNFSSGLEKEIEENRIILGGCCITGNDPFWKCTSCGTFIYRIEIDLDGSVN